MPPSQFLKSSKTKMQAWVTNNGLSNSQPAPSAYDTSPSKPHQRHHVYDAQATPSATHSTHPAQQNSPPRSRAPIVNANSTRAASALAGRIPVPSRSSHTRDASLNLPRPSRAISSEPLQPSVRPMPFWEGSTVDGSLSDNASNIDASAVAPHHYRVPYQAPTWQPRQEIPRPSSPPPILRDTKVSDQHPPFVIGANGLMEVLGGHLTRSASTPDTRVQRHGSKNVASDSDQYSEDNSLQGSPGRTPSSKRLYHPKTLTLRTKRPESVSERTAYQVKETGILLPRTHTYERAEPVVSDEVTDGTENKPSPRLRVKVQEPRRSTIFADTDTPLVSHPDEEEEEEGELEAESIGPPTPKPVQKTKPQVNRQLFSKYNKPSAGLDESAMPRSQSQKPEPSNSQSSSQAGSRKRQYDLDYDDGILSRMNYAQLKDEAFDYDPAQAEAQATVDPPRGTLPEKLAHFLDKDEESQSDFFTKMPVREWEDSGDWLLEQFGEVMQRFKVARQMKRALVRRFEDEIAERDAAVANKAQFIDNTLIELKTDGEVMMEGKEFD
ncbi:extracellular mutant protein 11-domain-containing protein [Xylariomycetidae sp. FL2044]|nr:extracellular mutant protein 11-domain-containing protein [Xylariomycetidae sp. FL2044]